MPCAVQRRCALEQLEQRLVLAAMPMLHSLAESQHKIYLDFDGHVVADTTWNTNFGVIHAPPFDIDGAPYEDGAPSFSEEEIGRIISIWERMAEDFRPFDVDVTTEDPSLAEPDIFHVGGRAQRVLFSSKYDAGAGGTGEKWFERAPLGSAAESWLIGDDTPAWVFSTHALAGEIGSHEVGHTLGLKHDGFVGADGEVVEYRGEHGAGETRWSPIMGHGNGLSQWSQGEYPLATNTEKDIGILVQVLGNRPDDYVSITPLRDDGSTSVDVEGIINTSGDKDFFSFDVPPGGAHVKLEISPWHNGPNLDIGVSLVGLATGPVVDVSDPLANPIDRLASFLDLRLGPDTYYLIVDGVGKAATPDDPGYSDYGSLGYYHITGTIGQSVPRGDINADGVLSAADIDALYAAIGTAPTPGPTSADLNEDGELNQTDVDVLIRDVLGTQYGDFDLNGRVEFADFLVLSANYGSHTPGWASGDATGEGQVTFADFLLLSAFFDFDAARQGSH